MARRSATSTFRYLEQPPIKGPLPKSPVEDVQVVRTSEGLRNVLFDQIEKVVNGKTTPMTANSIARMADGIIRTVELELEIERQARLLEKQGTNLAQLLPPTVPLGRKADAERQPIPAAPAFERQDDADE